MQGLCSHLFSFPLFGLIAFLLLKGELVTERLLVPGVVVKKSSDCFAQWRLKRHKQAAGFNFASAADAARVRRQRGAREK